MAGTVEVIAPEGSSASRAQHLPRYRVLLFNDDHNTMDWVVHSLMLVLPGIGAVRADSIMRTAHLKGVATVTVCPLEPAELYRDGLQSRGLVSRLERE